MIVDTANGTSTLSITTTPISGMDWSADDARLATSHLTGTIRIWNASDGFLLEELPYPGVAFAIAWSPSGTLLAYSGRLDSEESAHVEIIEGPGNPAGTTPLPSAGFTPTPSPTPTAVQ